MKAKKTIYVGGSLEEAGRRFVETWKKAARGAKVAPQDNVTFVSWSILSSVMSDKRHELLRHLHQHPATSVRALARALGRDYKRVYEDVAALAKAGLVEKDGEMIKADYDEIRTVITV
jgi:predicted transcriptional regulator